jgi:PiT family inorganic phosphate transporter
MLAALTAAGLWLLAATRLGWPVSTTHSIVGAIAGFGAVALGLEAVQWEKMLRIVASWGISPLLAGTLAFLIFNLIRRTILDHPQPVAQIRRWGPVYIFAVVAVIGLVTLFKGLKHVKLDLDFKSALALTVLIGLVVAGIGRHFILRISVDPDADASFHFATVERMFGVLQILSACAVAFAHGSNDVANAIGPLAAVLDIQRSGLVRPEAPVPPELLLIGGVGIVRAYPVARICSGVCGGVHDCDREPARDSGLHHARAGGCRARSGAGARHRGPRLPRGGHDPAFLARNDPRGRSACDFLLLLLQGALDLVRGSLGQ